MELLFLIFFMTLIIFCLYVPIMVAKSRGIDGADLTTITVLSWFGVFGGVTWVVALALALIYQPKNVSDVDRLEKLHRLKKSGAISQKEFDSEKKKIFGN